MKILINVLIFLFITNHTIAKENIMILKLKDGDVKIELFSDVAPNHVERIKILANQGKYDNVVFHRVIEGFMAQTGDVQFGNSSSDKFDLRKSGTGHKGFSFNTKTNVTLEEDLKRRDLTINAIAKTREGDLIDPFDGQKDLKNKILRQVSDAFKEDPLRVFRVARFSAKLKHLGFSVDKKTMETMNNLSGSGELESLPKERIWQETYKALQEKNPEEYFKVLIESEAIFKLEKTAKIDLELFKSIASKVPDPELRWASLAANFDCNLEGLNAAFGVPKKIQDLSRVFKK